MAVTATLKDAAVLAVERLSTVAGYLEGIEIGERDPNHVHRGHGDQVRRCLEARDRLIDALYPDNEEGDV